MKGIMEGDIRAMKIKEKELMVICGMQRNEYWIDIKYEWGASVQYSSRPSRALRAALEVC